MCGIFGYIGPQAGQNILLESLKRLEYRGYDSWGLALGLSEGLQVQRKSGRIPSNIDPDRTEPESRSWGGIAHTRWATHGAPTEDNAHPHLDCTGDVAIVHNGIVENHSALRQRLEADGHTFESDTDTEVIPHLIEEALEDDNDFKTAFLSALKLLEGTFGVVAMCSGSPDTILAARHGSPMVLGIGDGEMMIASDAAALVAHTRQVIYLEDDEAAILKADGYQTADLDATPITKPVHEIAFDLPDIERDGYPHFMLKEIFEQPETIRNAFRGRLLEDEGTAKLGGLDMEMLRKTKRCHILACGTSWHAGLLGKYLLENLANMPTKVSYAAEFRYSNPIIKPDTLAIAISQSGETADTLAGVREAEMRGANTMGICNVVGSTIARECGQGVYIHAGPEIGVASTKAFTGQVTVLALLAIHLGRLRGLGLRDATEFMRALKKLPEQAQHLLDQNETIKNIATQYADAPNFLYIGRLYEYPLALEGALKLKEISYIHAEGIPAAELKHGPIALVDENMPSVVLAAQSRILDKMKSNVQEINARGGRILAVAREEQGELQDMAEHTIVVPSTLDELVPILSVIPLQLLAYHIAVERGCDVDKPRNLAKSVTVE